MEKDEIKIWGKNLKFASKTTKEFSVTVIHDPFFVFSCSAALRSVAALLPYATCRSSKKLQLQKQNRTEENHRLARLGDDFMKTKKAEREWCRERGLSEDNR